MNSSRLAPILDLPDALRNREVDIIVLSSSAMSEMEEHDNGESKVESIMGILKDYANPALRELEKGAWERAAAEKYLERMNDGRS
jgi:translation elongation factor EF-Tu-like GTPase